MEVYITEQIVDHASEKPNIVVGSMVYCSTYITLRAGYYRVTAINDDLYTMVPVVLVYKPSPKYRKIAKGQAIQVKLTARKLPIVDVALAINAHVRELEEQIHILRELLD